METLKGYKLFNPDFTSKEGRFQFAENQSFEMKLPIKICSRGFHFCLKASDCFSYYDFDPNNIVCEVESFGETATHDGDSKVCTNKIKIGKRLSWNEVLFVANEGTNNTGHSNSGDRNSGDRNSGDRNSGYRNSGDRNSGDRNSGDRNSGNWNSGDRNSGDSNSGYRNSGAFCTEINPVLYLFNKPTKIKVKEWEQSKAVDLMYKIDITLWIPFSMMSEDEKKENPKAETCDGYLKTISYKEAWVNMWGNLSEENKKVFTDLPNFDRDIFFEITGIRVN